MERDDVRIFEDGRALAREGARLFAVEAGRAVRARGRFSAALPGGRTPRELFRTLSTFREPELPWPFIHLFWTDERMVPPDHARSNYRLAHEELLPHVAIPPRNVHRIHGELPSGKAALSYEEEILHHFGGDPPHLDLALLGVGADGHTASLFPGSPALDEQDALAVATHPTGVPGDHRVTLSLPMLRAARVVAFLATGEEKAEAVRRILSGGSDRGECPAGRVRPREGKPIWLLDREAASLLPGRRG
jgi:6-phosphogluconolactonase